jgi:hypothetical protein
MTTDTGCAARRTIERILDLSADAQIQRRRVARDSAAYLALTNEITACAIALEFLCHEHQQETPPLPLAPAPPMSLSAAGSSAGR